VFDYFRSAEIDSIDQALRDLGPEDYTYEEIQLMRIKFMSELRRNLTPWGSPSLLALPAPPVLLRAGQSFS